MAELPPSPAAAPVRPTIGIHLELFPCEDGTYGGTFAMVGAGGSCSGSVDALATYTRLVRIVKRELKATLEDAATRAAERSALVPKPKKQLRIQPLTTPP